jgi:hypothetical protein
LNELINDCKLLEDRWVAEQRVFQVKSLHQRAERLRQEVADASLETWREIPIPFQ